MRKLLATAATLVTLLTAAASSAPAVHAEGSAYDFEFTSIDGTPMKLSQWRGKPLLVVNTASFCGFTKQYTGLQELWSRYEKEGLIVVGVPSNDFGNQEPGSDGEIKKFCEGGFGITFPLTTKQHVVGAQADPFFKWAAAAAGPDGAPQWNFHKYLIGRDGKLLRSFASKTSPMSPQLTEWVEKALAAKPAAMLAD